jgi:hypothetical protein
MQLDPEQIMFVGLLASAAVFVLKLLADWFGYQPGRGPLTVALFAVSVVLAGIWSGVFLPPFPPYADPLSFANAVLQWVAELLAMATPVVGMATLIYNILYTKVFEPLRAKFNK